MARVLGLGLLALVTLAGCDRRIEPFDPALEPAQPDLSRIFPPGAEQAAQPPVLPAAPGGGSPEQIRGTIRLADGLGDLVPEGAVLFLIGRPGETGPPVAAKRIAAPRFPLEFSLGPEDRMIESLPFQGPLRITARIDADGDASSRQPGDLQGAAAGRHRPGDGGVELVIDEVLPGPTARSPAADPPPRVRDGDESIRGVITLAGGLDDRVPEGSVLFVVARTGNSGPPLAVVRIPSPRFPLDFEIGPDDRMIRSRPFEGPLRLSARVDGDGDASSRGPGDLLGSSDGAHQPGDRGVSLVIDEVL